MGSDNFKRHMKTHGKLKTNGNWTKEIPTFDGSEFGTDKAKSKETMNMLKQLVETDPDPSKIARMEPNIEVLEEIMKPKSLAELDAK